MQDIFIPGTHDPNQQIDDQNNDAELNEVVKQIFRNRPVVPDQKGQYIGPCQQDQIYDLEVQMFDKRIARFSMHFGSKS